VHDAIVIKPIRIAGFIICTGALGLAGYFARAAAAADAPAPLLSLPTATGETMVESGFRDEIFPQLDNSIRTPVRDKQRGPSSVPASTEGTAEDRPAGNSKSGPMGLNLPGRADLTQLAGAGSQ